MSDDGVRYARNGDVRLAYRVFGESGPTLIWVPGWVVSTSTQSTNPTALTLQRSVSSPSMAKLWWQRHVRRSP